MDADRWRLAFGVFHQAIALDPAERAGWLAGACPVDMELRNAVEGLLKAHISAGNFLETPAGLHAVARAALAADDASVNHRGDSFATDGLPADSAGAAPFESKRFALRRVIGAGGMGIVYEAYDNERHQSVALKTIRRVAPAELYHLKREFRGLSDIAHRNLVSLYELVVDGPLSFFTMELVDGVDVVRALEGLPPAVRFARTREIFSQIAEGLAFLHRHGKLHRDIKPSNVLVAADGRVVILDFGLIADAEGDSVVSGRVAGTPAFMPPEDLAGGRASESSDWYGVGVTLYRTLTGRMPFHGSFEHQYRAKSVEDPEQPACVVEGVPADLNAICADLVSRDRDRRRSGWTALRRLVSAPSAESSTRAAEGDGPFVGRKAALDTLGRAFSTLQSGCAVALLIEGPSGIGKSALVQHFLGTLPTSSPVVILRGRCYEREAIPYKALDDIIDSLGQYLRGLPAGQRKDLLPADFAALAQMFPVLANVDAATNSPVLRQAAIDPVILRRLGLAALRQLLIALGRRQPVILFVEDLHWADADSATLLGELLGPPNPPALLTLLCFRSEEAAAKPFLRTLLDGIGGDSRVSVALDRLSDFEAAELVAPLVSRSSVASDQARMIREADGNPLFLKQVAHYLNGVAVDASESMTFAAMLKARVDALTPSARRFLVALAVCGRPTPPQVVFHACRLGGDDRALVTSLQSAHLVRSSGSSARIELYHDRIRSALATMVAADEASRIHRLMAEALVADGFLDPEDLFDHYAGAGDCDRAAVEAVRAAEQAGESLAFERAAHFYQRAVALAPDSIAARQWERELARMLANAGRPADAAAVYIRAAEASNPGEQIDLRRQAAEQLLAGGHLARGLEVIRSVLAAFSLSIPRGPRAAFISLVRGQLQLWWRGLSYVPRSPSAIAEHDLQRVDACWSATTGLAMVDTIRAASLQTRHLLLALDTGEPYRVTRALALQVAFQAGGLGLLRGRSFVTPADAMSAAERVGHPHVIALASLTSGLSAAVAGNWRGAVPACERALDILREECAGATWEINQSHFFLLGSLLYLGELREVSARLPELLASAQERGNLFLETELRTRMNLVWLAADKAEEGAREARDAMRAWPHEGFQRQHYNLMLALVQTALYRGDADEAWTIIADSWTPMKRALLLRIPVLRLETAYLRARCALQKARTRPRDRTFLTLAKGDIARIRRERITWSMPVAALLDAGVASCEGRGDAAASALESAEDGFAREGMQLYVAVVRRRLGALIGGEAGESMVRSANEWMAGQQIRNPPAMARLLAPGFPD